MSQKETILRQLAGIIHREDMNYTHLEITEIRSELCVSWGDNRDAVERKLREALGL